MLGISLLMEDYEIAVWIEDRKLQRSPRFPLQLGIWVNNILGLAMLI